MGEPMALDDAEPTYVVEPPPAPSGALDPHPVAHADADEPETTPPVLAAVALGFVPVPFLALYTLLFLLHGLFVPVQPPDITRTRGGEAIAGFVTLVLLVAFCWTLAAFLGRTRRWPFALAQLATLAAAVYFLSDSNTGPRLLPILLLLTSVGALGLAFAPPGWAHLGQPSPDLRALAASVRAWRPPTRSKKPDAEATPTAADT